MLGNKRSRYVLTAAAAVVLLGVLVGVVACGGDSKPKSDAQPGVTAGSHSSVEASPSLEPPVIPTSAAPPSPSPTDAQPSPSNPASRAAEDGFNVRPPGTGHGPADSLLRTAGTNVALTFDDGPDPVNTPAILKVLKDNGVKATFCMVGFRVRDHPELVRQIYADGHTLCNHSWQHLLNLGKRDPSYIEWDLRHTNDMIHAAVGNDAPIKYFRAPGGNFTPSLVAKAKELGMTSIYWDVDPQDWNHRPDRNDQTHIDRVIAQVKSHVRQGSIILSHDNGQPDTIVAYRTLIPWLKRYFVLEGLPTGPGAG
ncbi:polysaccharide deacetylase family protein [Dactylosporangium sp. CA-233914]|uniref:polysaccharide deacetylase family protein n=1 Tax=Dactylosporangium sp. CA-233914 TaxID=3239934 RepID=UPI003D8DAE34